MVAEPASPPPLLQLLRSIDRKATNLASALHPDWVMAVEERLGIAFSGGPLDAAQHSRVLAAAYDVRWPPLVELRQPVNRIALLAPQDMWRVLAACALDRQRERVRVSIAREVRDVLIDRLGPAAHAELSAGASSGRTDGARPLEADELDLEQLAARGYRTLCRLRAWTSREALALTRMSLSPAVVSSHVPDLDDACDTGADEAPAFHRLHLLFPELAWLFGSDMDRALSESTMD